MAFYPGQRVVCVNGEKARSRAIGGWAPRTGGVYTVRGSWCHDEMTLLLLEEYVHPDKFDGVNEYGWDATRFRPLDEKRLDVFRAMLAPKPKVRENSHA